jgi:hypothetical protein
LTPEKGCAVFSDQGEARVVAEELAGYSLDAWVDVDAGEGRGGIHAGEQSGGRDASSRAEFEQTPARFGGSEDLKQRAGAGLGGHTEGELDSAGFNRWQLSGRGDEGLVKHGVQALCSVIAFSL